NYSRPSQLPPLSLHDALPICLPAGRGDRQQVRPLVGRIAIAVRQPGALQGGELPADRGEVQREGGGQVGRARWPVVVEAAEHARSEEHTSELQSRENLVCRLL